MQTRGRWYRYLRLVSATKQLHTQKDMKTQRLWDLTSEEEAKQFRKVHVLNVIILREVSEPEWKEGLSVKPEREREVLVVVDSVTIDCVATNSGN